MTIETAINQIVAKGRASEEDMCALAEVFDFPPVDAASDPCDVIEWLLGRSVPKWLRDWMNEEA